jgi:DnaJ-class molecular chaperone
VTLEPGEYAFKCSECDGEGSIEGLLAFESCRTCNGEGFQDVFYEAANETVREPCNDCDGVGSPMVSMLCEDCRGTGEIVLDEEEAAERIAYGHSPLRTP